MLCTTPQSSQLKSGTSDNGKMLLWLLFWKDCSWNIWKLTPRHCEVKRVMMCNFSHWGAEQIRFLPWVTRVKNVAKIEPSHSSQSNHLSPLRPGFVGSLWCFCQGLLKLESKLLSKLPACCSWAAFFILALGCIFSERSILWVSCPVLTSFVSAKLQILSLFRFQNHVFWFGEIYISS